MLRFVFSIAILFGAIHISIASHIVGGELTYRCLGQSQFELTLTIYRDCFNGIVAFDDPAILGIYQNDSGLLFAKVKIAFNEASNDTLPVDANNPCLQIPANVCVHKASYLDTITLPFWQAGYTVVYQTCCHNGQIRNIHDPKNTGVSFTAEISGLAQLTCNQAAIFDLWPPVAICIHHPLSYDHSASDADGDSLSYRLCAPFAGPDSLHSEPDPPAGPPYLDLQWIDPPYNLDNLLGGTPLSIDSISGLMTAIPNTLGAFVVGVCLDEYRNGEWLSTTRREFQYNVTQCTRPVAEISVPDIVCDEFEVAFLNESLQSNHFLWFFDWPMPNPSSTESAPVHVYSDTGNYTIALIVEPNTMCSDTSFAEIQLVSTGGTLELNAEPSTVVVGASTQLSALFPGAISYQWMPSTGLSNDQISNPTAIPSESTEYNVKALLSNGCVKTGSIVITVVEPPCAEPYLFFPTGFSPNGDGQNDELKLEGNNTLQVSWFIFNRWGEQVFEAQSLSDSWNGTFRGVPQPAEVYGYYLKVICTNGEEFVRKGNVTLIR